MNSDDDEPVQTEKIPFPLSVLCRMLIIPHKSPVRPRLFDHSTGSWLAVQDERFYNQCLFMVRPEIDEGSNHARTTKLHSAVVNCLILQKMPENPDSLKFSIFPKPQIVKHF